MSYEAFKSFVESQTSTLLMNSNRLPVNIVDSPQCAVVPDNYDNEGEEEETINAFDEDGNFIGAHDRNRHRSMRRRSRSAATAGKLTVHVSVNFP